MKYIFANKIKLFLLLSIFWLTGINSLAATHIVTKLPDTNDGVCNNDCSLREAVTAASNGDKIYFQMALSGTITLIHGNIEINKNITVNGSDKVSVSGGDKMRVFLIKGGAVVTMKHMEIKNGFLNGLAPQPFGGLGAGINVSGSTLNLYDSNIHHNEAYLGGGIHVGDSGTLKITNTEITANKAGISGGISCGLSTLEINDSSITQNESVMSGGGIGTGTCALTITNSTVSQNKANVSDSNPGYGGGIDLNGEKSTLKILNSSIIGNKSSFGAGVSNRGKLYLINSTVSGNTAHWSGGGVYSDGHTVIRNSTITNNYGLLSAGGLCAWSSNIYLSNSIIAGNSNSQNSSRDIGGTVNSFGYNIIGFVGNANILAFGVGDKLNTDPMLGALANNGGPTQTHLPLPGSPAINSGSNGLAVDANAQPLTTDQRSYARIGSGTVDIGAVETPGRVAPGFPVFGKVKDSFGKPIRNANVKITDMNTGNSRMMRINAFGDFRFDEVEHGQTYLFEVLHKDYVFMPQAVTVTEETGELNFIGGNVN